MQARLDLDALRRHTPERTAALESQHDHPDRLFAALRAFVGTLPDKTDEMHRTLAAVDHPTLVAALDEDPLFSLNDMLDVHDRLANARLAVLPGTRHRLAEAPLAALTPLLRDHFSVQSEAPSPNL
jgi:pimeloyl-ACP methyl ester carboxylesterase